MHRSIPLALIGLLLACILAAQKQEAVPKDLMEYVRQARKAGLADSQIKLNAVRVGWPPEDLDTALEPRGGEPATKPKTAETRKPAPKHSPSPSAAAIKPAEALPMVNEPVGRGAAPTAAANAAPDDEYFIGAGDVVQVSVWGEQAASVPSAVVRPDGKISMPLLKEVAISGLTPTQAGKTIGEQLDVIRLGGKKEDCLPFDYDAVVKGGRSERNITLEPGDTIVVPH